MPRSVLYDISLFTKTPSPDLYFTSEVTKRQICWCCYKHNILCNCSISYQLHTFSPQNIKQVQKLRVWIFPSKQAYQSHPKNSYLKLFVIQHALVCVFLLLSWFPCLHVCDFPFPYSLSFLSSAYQEYAGKWIIVPHAFVFGFPSFTSAIAFVCLSLLQFATIWIPSSLQFMLCLLNSDNFDPLSSSLKWML